MKRGTPLDDIVAGLDPAAPPRLLLHSCCGPCSSAVLERLTAHFSVTVYYYNPNIGPEEEYLRRRAEQEALLSRMPFRHPVSFLEGEYEPARFYEAARGLEAEPEGGARCEACFRLRLREAARMARDGGFAWFTTTLSVSPHKNAALLNRIGAELAEQTGVGYLWADFKKRDGYRRSIELSRLYGLWRQDYCGCVFSKKEAEERRERRGVAAEARG